MRKNRIWNWCARGAYETEKLARCTDAYTTKEKEKKITKMATRKNDACEFGKIKQNSNFLLKYDDTQWRNEYKRYVFAEVTNITLWAIIIICILINFNFNYIYNIVRNNIAKIDYT